MIGPGVGISARPHAVTVYVPGAPVPDGEGGFTQTWRLAAVPTWQVEVTPLTAGATERVIDKEGTTFTGGTHQVTGPYRPDLSTEMRLAFGARVLHIDAVRNPDERGAELVVVCSEVVLP